MTPLLATLEKDKGTECSTVVPFSSLGGSPQFLCNVELSIKDIKKGVSWMNYEPEPIIMDNWCNQFTLESKAFYLPDSLNSSLISITDEAVIYSSDNQRVIRHLRDLYVIKNVFQLMVFLSRHKNLIKILFEAKTYIESIFGNDSKIVIEAFNDIEESFEGLAVDIFTQTSIDHSFELLDKFYSDYWSSLDSSFTKYLAVNIKSLE